MSNYKFKKSRVRSAICLAFGLFLVFGLINFSAPKTSAVQTTVNFRFTLTDEAKERGVSISAYNYDPELEQDVIVNYPGTGSFLGVISTGIENNNEPLFSRLEPEYSNGQRVQSNKIAGASCNQDGDSCVVSVLLDLNGNENDRGVRFSRPGNAGFDILDEHYERHSGTADNLMTDTNFYIDVREAGYRFDGKAFLIWACGKNDEETCLYRFDDLTSTMGNLDLNTLDYQYYPAKEIVDERTGEKFDLFGDGREVDGRRGFVHPDALRDWIAKDLAENEARENELKELSVSELIGQEDFSKISAYSILRGAEKFELEQELIENGICDGELERREIEVCVDDYAKENNLAGIQIMDLVWSDEGTYRSHGDNQFKVFIYSDDYRAVSVVDFDDLDYIPFGFGSAPVGLFGSTIENPKVMEMPLQDDSIKFSELLVDGEPLNGFSISEIRALGVPEGAVTIKKDDDGFEITWHSNFFDQVLFEIEDREEKDYYLIIERTTFGEIAMEHLDTGNNGFSGVRVEFFFDDQTSYTDYELFATIVYSDGKVEMVPMENLGWVDSNRGANLKYVKEYDGEGDKEGDMSGKNLKRANYGIAFSDRDFQDEIDEIYFNVKSKSKDGSFGAFAGSGHGYNYVIEHREELGEE